MGDFDLMTGDIVTITNLTHYTPDLQIKYGAPKGEVFVVVLLGTQKKDGSSPLDIDQAMARLGWQRIEEKAKG